MRAWRAEREAHNRAAAAAARAGGDAQSVHAHLDGFATPARHSGTHYVRARYQHALQWAVARGELPLVRFLCHLPPCFGVTPAANQSVALWRAVEAGHMDVVRFLCDLPDDRGVAPGAVSSVALRTAAGMGRLDMVRFLCELPTRRNVNPGSHHSECLHVAAQLGHLHVVRYLCELPVTRGVEPGTSSNAPLRAAAASGHLDVVRYLCELPVDRGVVPGAMDNEALFTASQSGHLPVVRYLCELPPDRGVQPAAQRNGPLYAAAAWGRLEVVRYLCKLPPDRGVEPAVALQVAAGHGRVEVVRYLCERLPAAHKSLDPAADDNGALWSAAKVQFCTALSQCKVVVWYLHDLPAVVQGTPMWRLVNRIACRYTARESWYRTTAQRMLPFLVRTLPGGDAWLDHDGDFQEQHLARLANDRRGEYRTLWLQHRQRRTWRRRRAVWLLRLLRDRQRARFHPQATRRTHAGHSKRLMPATAKRRRGDVDGAVRMHKRARCGSADITVLL